MRKLILLVMAVAFAVSAGAQNTQADLSKSGIAKENSQISVNKKEDSKARELAMQRERAEIKEKTEDIRIARLKQQHLQATISRDKEELKKKKAEADKLESKIAQREKDIASIKEKIKEEEAAISKLQSQASNSKKLNNTKASKNTSD